MGQFPARIDHDLAGEYMATFPAGAIRQDTSERNGLAAAGDTQQTETNKPPRRAEIPTILGASGESHHGAAQTKVPYRENTSAEPHANCNSTSPGQKKVGCVDPS